ncbi:MAG: universal stress protein [Micromonosporaceae bacterium]
MTTTHLPVVAGVDGSPHSYAAAEQAADAAARRGLELHLVHGYLHPLGYGSAPLQPYPVVIPEPSPEADDMLRDVAAKMRERHPGLTVQTRQVMGGPAGALVAESQQAEMLFVGSRGLGGFKELLLGSVSSQVAAHAQCPVVVVRSGPAGTAGEVGPLREGPVMVGVDGSDLSKRAVEFAFTEAGLRTVPLVAVHVYWVRSVDHLEPPSDDLERKIEEAAEQLLADGIAEPAARHPEVQVERRLIHNLNTEYSMIEATRDAGLMVVGSRGRGGFTGLLLGSVSQALVHHAHCPVAVVHPPRD